MQLNPHPHRYPHLRALLLLALGSFAAAGSADVIVTTSTGRMMRVNPETGAATLITTGRYYVGMGWSASGEMVGLRAIPVPSIPTSYLDRLDPQSGDRTIIATTNICVVRQAGSTYGGAGFCVTPDGTGYAFEYQTIDPYTRSRVSAVNTSDGSAGFVGDMGLTSDGALASDASGRIWGTRGGLGRQFFELDRSTGQARVVGSLADGPSIFALAFHDGQLYAFDAAGGIGTINRDTAELTHVSTFTVAGNGQIYTAVSGTPLCQTDFNGDGFLDFFDYADFVNAFESGAGLEADFNNDGFVDFFDYAEFVAAFEAGC